MISDIQLAELLEDSQLLNNYALVNALIELSERRNADPGMPIKLTRVPVMVRLDKSTITKLDDLAKQLGETRAGAVRVILESHFTKDDPACE